MKELNFSNMCHIFVIPRGLRGHSLLRPIYSPEFLQSNSCNTFVHICIYICLLLIFIFISIFIYTLFLLYYCY